MTHEPVEYCYTLANPRRVPGIDGTACMMYPDVSSENWEGPFDSIREAVEDARLGWRDRHGYYPEWGEYVAVAPLELFKPTIDVDDVLERISQDAYNAVDDLADGFVESLDEITRDDREALYSALQADLCTWLKERNLMPRFGNVKTSDFKYYPLWEGAAL